MVAGQDSVFAELYQGKIMWFWGDTSRMSYPLGHFWMAAAVSELPGQGGLDPDQGVNLRYFTDQDGFSRPVARLGVEKGVIWADGFLTLPDETGRERLVCHYAHMESLAKMLDHGLAVFNDEKAEFERLKTLEMKDGPLFPGQGHPIRHRDGDVRLHLLWRSVSQCPGASRLEALPRPRRLRSLHLPRRFRVVGRNLRCCRAPTARCVTSGGGMPSRSTRRQNGG